MTMMNKKELEFKTHLKMFFHLTSKEGERYPFFAQTVEKGHDS